jgi:hypothetical protein
MVRSRWSLCPDALELLESGGPFDTKNYRLSWTRCFPNWRDVSFGAETPNGTRAAVSLFLHNHVAVSPPYNYGTIVATQQLGEATLTSFLNAARVNCGARRLIVHSVPVRPMNSTAHVGGRVSGWTTVVYLDKSATPEARFAQKARRSMRIAERAGAKVVTSENASGFLRLYSTSSIHHWLQYAPEFVTALGDKGVARFFDVYLQSDLVASVAILTSRSHWTAWLAAQNERGRDINANYLAVGEMLAAAQRAGISAVNLGSSADMPGVGHFKRRFDSVDVPVIEYRVGPWVARAQQRVARLATRAWRSAGSNFRTPK